MNLCSCECVKRNEKEKGKKKVTLIINLVNQKKARSVTAKNTQKN